jgi:hypothetical protein
MKPKKLKKRICHGLTLVICSVLIISSNQTSSFADAEHAASSHHLVLDDQYSIETRQLKTLNQRGRYSIQLYNHKTGEVYTALSRPSFGQVTEVLQEKSGEIIVLMEGSRGKEQYLLIDNYRLNHRDTSVYLTHEKKIAADTLATQQDVYHQTYKYPVGLPGSSSLVILNK